MKILIAGAGGLVGKEFTRQLSREHQVLAPSHDEFDITDRELVAELVLRERPELLINCAVLGVDASELDPPRAWSVNVAGAENLARAASTIDAEIVQLSTNYVFDGRRRDGLFYTIEDPTKPVNVYGETKLAGEHAVRSASRRSFIIRTSWVFGDGRKSFFNTIHTSLTAGNSVRAITGMWASATYVRDLVTRVIEILRHHKYATYHIVNAELCSYYDFALEAAGALRIPDSEVQRLIAPVQAAEVFSSAQRPVFTPMRCLVSEGLGLTPMRSWRAAAAEFISGSSGP